MPISEYTRNRLVVLKTIQRHGPLARSALPKLTGLSSGLVSQLTGELVEGGYLSETRDQGLGRGRPRLLLALRKDTAVVLGASIDGRGNLVVAFANLAGECLHLARVSFPQAASLSDLANLIGHSIARAIADSPIDVDRLARVGIALPALIDSYRGEVHFNTTFPVARTPFSAPIADLLRLPVTIENDMDCMARAEHWFGSLKQHDDFVFVRVGNSIDAAMFSGGLPHFGSTGLNSSFGHTKANGSHPARPCFCGGVGCLAAHASMYGILEGAGLLSDLPFPPVDDIASRFAQFVARAKAGDPVAQLAVKEGGGALGTAIGNLLNITTPAQVFIAVDDTDYSELLRPAFQKSLEATAMPGVLPLTKITFFKSTDEWRWQGPAALALEQLYLDDWRNHRTRLLHSGPRSSASQRSEALQDA